MVKISETRRWAVIQVVDIFIVACYFLPVVPFSEIEEMLQFVEMELMIDWNRVVIAGDINAQSRKLLMDSMTNQRGREMEKIIEEMDLQIVILDMGKWTSFSVASKGIPDWIVTSSAMMNFKVRVHIHEDKSLSGLDHRPVTVEFQCLRLATKLDFEQWNIRKIDKPECTCGIIN